MKDIFKQIIIDFHKSEIQAPNPREFTLPKIKSPIRKAFVFAGMRRSGKTWAMYWQIHKLLEQGTGKTKILYINFEDDRLISMQHHDFQAILDAYFSLYPTHIDIQDIHFFFDEIHEIPGWEKFIRRLLDQEKMAVYISGSSARMLGREIANALRGRTFLQEIFPYSLREYLACNNVVYQQPFTSRELAVISHFTEKYLIYGGFPEAVALDPVFHRQLLQGYMDVVIYRDIIERHHITNTHITRNLITYCLQNLATPVSINKLYHRLKSQGKSVGKNSLYELMDYIQDAYCIFSIPLFTFSRDRQAVNPKKIYAADQGLITAYSVKPEFEEATRLENAVFCELRRRTDEIYYYKTRDNKEVDFVACERNGARQLFQVCVSLGREKTYLREVSALEQAMKELELKIGWIISTNEKKIIETGAGVVEVMPFSEWVIRESQA